MTNETPASEADEGPCTDCWDTGINQNERRCACQPPTQPPLPGDEVERVASAIGKALVWEVENDTYASELTIQEQRKVAQAAIAAMRPTDLTRELAEEGEEVQRQARRAIAWRDEVARLKGLFAALSCDQDACAVARQYARDAMKEDGPSTYDIAHGLADQVATTQRELADTKARLAEAVGMLEPFAAVAEWDIGENEDYDDFFTAQPAKHHAAPRLIVGHFREAFDFLAKQEASHD